MLENEVVSFELAKKLKELGFPQDKCSHIWLIYCGHDDMVELVSEQSNKINYDKSDCYTEYSAPLSTEILRELPNKIFYNFETLAYGLVMSISRDSLKDFIVGYYRRGMKEACIEIRETNLVDALAKMWIWLKENEYI